MQPGLFWLLLLFYSILGAWAGLTVDVNQVVYIGFDRYNGEHLFDNSPHHNNATLQNGTLISKIRGSCGRCLQLLGGNVKFKGKSFEGIPYIAVTVMMMVQLVDTSGTLDLFQTMGSPPTSFSKFAQFQLQSDNGRVKWFHRNEKMNTVFSIITDMPVLHPGNWYNVAVTYNGLTGTSQIFVDGKLKKEETADPGVFLSTDWSEYAGIGRPGGDPRLRGYVDEFYVFNKSLSTMEMEAVNSVCKSSVVFHAGFEQKNHNVFKDDSGLLNDVTLSVPPKFPGKKQEDPIPVPGTCGDGVQITGPMNDLKLDGRTFRNKPVDAVTVALWVNVSSIAGKHFLFVTIGGHSQHKHDQYEFSLVEGAVRWIHKNEYEKTIFSVLTDPIITEKRWAHIVGTYNDESKRAKIYVNGNLNRVGPGSGHLSEDWDGYAGFGKHQGGMMDYDLLDEIYMFSRELSPFEIKMLYENCNFGNARMPPNTFQSVVFFGFDRDSGHTVFDDSGNENNGQMSQDANVLETKTSCGNCLVLSGGDLLLEGSHIKRKPLFSITVALWVKLETNRGEQTIFMTSNPGNPGNRHVQYLLLIIDGKVKWFHSNEKSQTVFSAETESAVVPAGTWTHISGTYTSMGGKSQIFVNGDLKKEDFTGSGTLSQDWGGRVSIGKFFRKDAGKWLEERPLYGEIDEFYMFDRALPPTEVTLLMQSCDFKRTVLHFGFEVFEKKTAFDQSGLANNGRVLDATGTPAGKCGKGLNMTAGGEIDLDGVLFNITHFREKPQKAISVTAWINLATNRGHHELFNTIGSRSTHKHDQYHLTVEDGKVVWYHHQEQDRKVFEVQTLPVVPARNWTHIAATYSAEEMLAKVYVNGKLVKERSAYGYLSQDWGHFAGVGRRFYKEDGYLRGILDNFMMFNYALDEEEIAVLSAGDCPKGL
ncbi:uncharacterized protein LOC5512916 [Nematostella vectensis]|uniref:uncharacterized protein LOC5512916 n=1 Tax=Nematostella vectensis TaxID=45351 RepID=UPI00207740FA|nr:uncharacterized protein LOC5512916 [Nematostella vectensis]